MTSNDKYRYENVTMGVLMRDFVFDKNAPKANDFVPEFWSRDSLRVFYVHG